MLHSFKDFQVYFSLAIANDHTNHQVLVVLGLEQHFTLGTVFLSLLAVGMLETTNLHTPANWPDKHVT